MFCRFCRGKFEKPSYPCRWKLSLQTEGIADLAKGVPPISLCCVLPLFDLYLTPEVHRIYVRRLRRETEYLPERRPVV